MDISEFHIKLVDEISGLAAQDCECCIYSYESLSDHTCNVYPWWRKVCFYFGKALLNISFREDTKEKALEYILNDESRFQLKEYMENNSPRLFDQY